LPNTNVRALDRLRMSLAKQTRTRGRLFERARAVLPRELGHSFDEPSARSSRVRRGSPPQPARPGDPAQRLQTTTVERSPSALPATHTRQRVEATRTPRTCGSRHAPDAKRQPPTDSRRSRPPGRLATCSLKSRALTPPLPPRSSRGGPPHRARAA
jgi:hypothetical protein